MILSTRSVKCLRPCKLGVQGVRGSCFCRDGIERNRSPFAHHPQLHIASPLSSPLMSDLCTCLDVRCPENDVVYERFTCNCESGRDRYYVDERGENYEGDGLASHILCREPPKPPLLQSPATMAAGAEVLLVAAAVMVLPLLA